MISKKHFVIGILIGIILIISVTLSLPDGRLHLIFCNVGQGDATYIKTASNQDILIDGGPDGKVLSCLSRHMPFYDRTIDTVILSHPNKDHYQGLITVLERYKVNHFIIQSAGEDTIEYHKLQKLLEEKKIPVRNLYLGDRFSLGKTNLSVLWPEKQWVVSQFSTSLSDLPAQAGLSVLGLSTTTDLNNFSYYLHLSYGSFDALFTGDGDSKIQPEILSRVSLPDVEILKFPHHGSKYGVLDDFLEKVKPELAVISVGKNPYGHPANETIKQLSDKAIKILRTDQKGDIEAVSDGQKWWLR